MKAAYAIYFFRWLNLYIDPGSVIAGMDIGSPKCVHQSETYVQVP
jgi:hypothetical protein